MIESTKKPYTLTIKKEIISGKSITFSGRRAPVFARRLLEDAIAMNSYAKAEKENVLGSLSTAIDDAGALLAAPQDGKGEAAKRLGKSLLDFNAHFKQLRSKLVAGPMPNGGIYADAARQLIIGGHIANTLQKIHNFGLELIGSMGRNDGRMAEKWLKLMRNGQARIEGLSLMLDGLSQDSIWEIKALVERPCTRAALRAAEKFSRIDESTRQRLVASASYLEILNSDVAFILDSFIPLLEKIRDSAQSEMAENGERYGKEMRVHIDAIMAVMEGERLFLSGLPHDCPQLAAIGVFEHHIADSTSAMTGMLSFASVSPGRVSAISSKSAADALRFLQIIGRVRESDSPGDLELVFKRGSISDYLKALEGKYCC